MHIPDGFLSTPVWVSLDVAALPAVGLIVRKAQQGFEESRAPLLGVLGAFVFAAQMINFPVGVGTSGHLIGSALLASVLGPAAASVVMVAILAIQALVFQDGGILALGPNVLNMAVIGTIAGYLPYYLWGTKRRSLALFAGGVLSVFVSALLALGELMLSGVPMPGPVLGISLVLFLVSAILEGAITVAVVRALEAMNPGFVRKPQARGWRVPIALASTAVLLAVAGVWFASTNPDGIEKLARVTGISSHAKTLISTPLADYEAGFFQSAWLRKGAAGLAGLVLIFGACVAAGRVIVRRKQPAA